MLKICLSRVGKKKQPVYRVIVLEKGKDPWGDYLELLGHYNLQSKPKKIEFKADRIKYWLGQGAKASPTLYNLFVDQGIIGGEKVRASSGKIRRNKKTSKSTPQPGQKDNQNKEPATASGNEPETTEIPKVTNSQDQPREKPEKTANLATSEDKKEATT
jgi:small subunit ribosomal protein S16